MKPENNEKKIIPSHIQIETVAGYCTVRCIMCPIENSLRKEIMSNDLFERIIQKLLPIKNNIKLFSIVGIGEPLIDKEKGIEKIVFDRSGYTYHGKVKTLADALRKGGLKF